MYFFKKNTKYLNGARKKILWILQEFRKRAASFKSKKTTTTYVYIKIFIYFFIWKVSGNWQHRYSAQTPVLGKTTIRVWQADTEDASTTTFYFSKSRQDQTSPNLRFIKKAHHKTFPYLSTKIIEPTGHDVMQNHVIYGWNLKRSCHSDTAQTQAWNLVFFWPTNPNATSSLLAEKFLIEVQLLLQSIHTYYFGENNLS